MESKLTHTELCVGAVLSRTVDATMHSKCRIVDFTSYLFVISPAGELKDVNELRLFAPAAFTFFCDRSSVHVVPTLAIANYLVRYINTS